MTSSIYTARHVAGSQNTVPLFKLHGLDNFAPSPISTLNLAGVALTKQTAYTAYATNISCFLWATKTKATTLVNGLPLGLFDSSDVLPLNCPPVQFTLKKAVDSDKSIRLVNSLGPGASTSTSGKTTIYHAPALPDGMLDTIIALTPAHFNCGRDAVNPAGAFAYKFLSSVCATFLRTHSYPAFSYESDESIQEFHTLHDVKDTEYIPYNTKDKEGKDVSAFAPIAFSSTLQGREMYTPDQMTDDDATTYPRLETPQGRFSTSGNDTVHKAKPCRKPQTNIGSSRDVPNLPGIAFPYFHGLVQPDAVFMSNVILQRFFQLLGSTVQKSQDTFLTIRRGCGSLSTTKEGMMLSHLLKGIDLALDTQSRCFMIFEAAEYKGFVLLGARFSIFDQTKWIAPSTEEQLSLALLSLDPHESAVSNLVSAFGRMTAEGTYTGPSVDRKTFTEPENLIEVFSGVRLTELDDVVEKEVNQSLRSLNYMGAGYIVRNPQMIADALETLASDTVLKLSRPTYIPSIRVNLSSRAFIILSRFGPEAISFWNERGVEIRCEAKEKPVVSGGKRKLGEMDAFANMPDKLFITPKPLSIAIQDFEKMLERQAIKVDSHERAGKYRNMVVESEEFRKRIWLSLVKIAGEAGPKKKRARREEDAGEGEVDLDDLLATLIG
ncbi:hypothetical protein [Cryphonectria parasitica ambivirus 1]|uniref:Uncharacterized protein n=1 Tax=Cryphonectria parasitica ambivirus 1 TaxID=2755407 RepID=A0A7D7F083_9VIRU|nr:hypothetical protein [Cryphonectria parasitica ambivirus 1]